MSLEIYDCTLRDGEQAAGASFTLEDRIALFRLLDNFGMDYIELGWPIASEEVRKAFKICDRLKRNSKISAFGSTAKLNPIHDKNLKAIIEAEADVACIFGKTSLEHIKHQLRTTPERNLDMIRESIDHLRQNHLPVFYDAEHFFDGFKENREYALRTLVEARRAGAERLVLCDTNGGTFPEEIEEIVKQTYEELSREAGHSPALGIHLHNDQGLAIASSLRVLKFLKQIQGTINGLGERVGNLDFSGFLPLYSIKHPGELRVNLKDLKHTCDEACRLSGRKTPQSQPFVGDLAFTHKGGVHIDALTKGGASYEFFNPAQVGNTRKIDLNTLGGSAGVVEAAKQMGYQLDKRNPETREKIEKLYEELKRLEERGYRIGTLPAEQYLLIAKYFGRYRPFFELTDPNVRTGIKDGQEFSEGRFLLRTEGVEKETSKIIVGGPIDVSYKTIQEFLSKEYPLIRGLNLSDYHVEIAKARREESTVRTLIEFSNGTRFQTVGVDNNIILSSLEAITKGFRYFLNVNYNPEQSSTLSPL